MIRGEADKNRQLYDGVLDQLKKTSLTSGMEFGGFRVIEQALPPTVIDSPKPLWNLSLAALLGLALGVSARVRPSTTGTRRSRRSKRSNSWTCSLCSARSACPGTSAAPRQSDGAGPAEAPGAARQPGISLTSHDEPAERQPASSTPRSASNPVAAEDIRTICASLLLSRSGRPPRVLLVTSAAPGEGKTTIAAALAQTLARDAAPAPSSSTATCAVAELGTIFGVAGDGGLTLYLAGTWRRRLPPRHRQRQPVRRDRRANRSQSPARCWAPTG